MISDSFKKVNPINGTEKVDDSLLHAYSPAGLIQAVGYLKYRLGEKNYGLVFRGQSDLYGKNLRPALYRGIKRIQSTTSCNEYLNNIIINAERDFGETLGQHFKIKPQFVNPLLQHYGIKTEWLDVVDNIWIALWFACYEALSIDNIPFMILKQRNEKSELRKKEERLKKLTIEHDSKREVLQNVQDEHKKICETKDISKELKRTISNLYKHERALSKEIEKLKNEIDELSSMLHEKSYAYILMIRCPGMMGNAYGIWKDANTELYDLRYCLPSTFLRPHAQHGMVIRKLAKSGKSTTVDFSSLIEGIIRIDLDDALTWLGDSILLSPESLFPSPVKDHGLQQLLKSETLRSCVQISTP